MLGQDREGQPDSAWKGQAGLQGQPPGRSRRHQKLCFHTLRVGVALLWKTAQAAVTPGCHSEPQFPLLRAEGPIPAPGRLHPQATRGAHFTDKTSKTGQLWAVWSPKPCLVVNSHLLLCFCCPGVPFLPNLPGLPHHVNFHLLGHHHQSSAGSPMRGYVCSETPAQIPEADPGQTHRIADMVGCHLSGRRKFWSERSFAKSHRVVPGT